MKLSADTKSEYWSPLAYTARVLLDGEELSDVVFADEEGGFVDFLAVDCDGRFVADGEDIATVRKFGKVQIVS